MPTPKPAPAPVRSTARSIELAQAFLDYATSATSPGGAKLDRSEVDFLGELIDRSGLTAKERAFWNRIALAHGNARGATADGIDAFEDWGERFLAPETRIPLTDDLKAQELPGSAALRALRDYLEAEYGDGNGPITAKAIELAVAFFDAIAAPNVSDLVDLVDLRNRIGERLPEVLNTPNNATLAAWLKLLHRVDAYMDTPLGPPQPVEINPVERMPKPIF